MPVPSASRPHEYSPGSSRDSARPRDQAGGRSAEFARRRRFRGLLLDEEGQGVVEYAAVALVFVVVLIIVLTTLGDSIGQSLQGLLDQLPIGF